MSGKEDKLEESATVVEAANDNADISAAAPSPVTKQEGDVDEEAQAALAAADVAEQEQEEAAEDNADVSAASPSPVTKQESDVDEEAQAALAAADVAEQEETIAEIEPQAEGTVKESDGDEAEVLEPPQDDRAWYVIHCYSGHENKVKYNLEQRIETMQMQDQIFQVVIPTEDEIEVREGKRRTIERRVFPGYILVQMLLADDSWYVVRNTPGVTGFVGMGNEPTPLRSEEVQAIIKRMEAEAPRIKVTFKPGQKVRIIDGPFNEFIGVVKEIDMERAKVQVLVSFFGRETPVELDFLQVEKT